MYRLFTITCIYLLILSCQSEEDLGYEPTPVDFSIPSNFPSMEYDLNNNPLTEQGIALGKKLFFDGRLSSNNAIACAFCHEQEFAFTHHGHTLSHGVNGNIGFRNTPPLQNLAFQKEFGWDGAASHLDLQPIIPITNPIEMDETLENVIEKLKADSDYPHLFKQSFEDGEINTANMLQALSQFMLTMVSSNSIYDQVKRGEGPVFNPLESQGEQVFNQKCASCHSGTLFTDQSYRNNGLSINSRLDDKGRFLVLERQEDLYKFKVPSLRNVEVTAPYMHDGRFSTLKAVLDFYDTGMVDTGTIDSSLVKPDNSLGIDLTEQEKESLIAFLKTLTDPTFLNDDQFSEY
ncbi:MAG: cytochrome c peroxidase [Bacteroidota bacterium]|uniref:cytochrome-c peroxidase n=1 Tax=Nonlabens tegetincola TaxID=323273 RepID=UPI000A20265C|nr:cytochrome c peroxidase [Nonlabens tegetincola]ARN70927.1 cytochrome-c peroxidase [Nonlabens tegetincola]MEE2800807.1 cytochrome c peroxidase [Bacteroidota bacterium]